MSRNRNNQPAAVPPVVDPPPVNPAPVAPVVCVEFESAAQEDFASLLYRNYCESVGGKAFDGDPLPDWDTFKRDTAKQTQVGAWAKLGQLVDDIAKAGKASAASGNAQSGIMCEVEAVRSESLNTIPVYRAFLKPVDAENRQTRFEISGLTQKDAVEFEVGAQLEIQLRPA